MYIFRLALVALAGVCTFACEGDDPGDDVFGGEDPGTAQGAAAAPEATEVVAGGGRVKGGNVVMDVQIGHGASQRQAASDAGAVEGNSVVKQ